MAEPASASRPARSATTRSSGCSAPPPAARRARIALYSEADVARLAELIRLRDLLGLSLDELAVLAEAEEARAALRDRWSGTESDAERLRIVEEASAHIRRQLVLVRARQERLADFADELKSKLASLEQRRDGLQAGRAGPAGS